MPPLLELQTLTDLSPECGLAEGLSGANKQPESKHRRFVTRSVRGLQVQNSPKLLTVSLTKQWSFFHERRVLGVMLETGFPQRFAAEPFFFVCDWFCCKPVCRMLVETNPKDPYQLGISVRGNLCTENLENVESFLHLGSRRQGRAVCDADQLDAAEQNDAFTTSAYHSWRV